MDRNLEHGREYLRNTRDGHVFSYIGTGSLGGKASGLVNIKAALERNFPSNFYEGIYINIPRMTVLLSGVFEDFIRENDLAAKVSPDDSDTRIASMFQHASLPATITGDLWDLVSGNTSPLAVRSSSLLEDSLEEPFAGVYTTKMIPNNNLDPGHRFTRLTEAIKLVYASTFFRNAREYFAAAKKDILDERMAVIIQNVAGRRYGDSHYPTVSGVARSYNFYPAAGMSPDDGSVSLAFGLGKTVVDGGSCWTYCPTSPASPPPASLKDLLAQGQKRFWAVGLQPPAVYDPVEEAEYLLQMDLRRAERDGLLAYTCSTYNPESDRLEMGLGPRGARLLDFAPLLRGGLLSFNPLIKRLLDICRNETGGEVEIEFALSFDPRESDPPVFSFLQLRPMAVSTESVDIESELEKGEARLASYKVLGNGAKTDIRDIVFVPPESFSASRTSEMAREIETINSYLVSGGTPYILIGFGRWGSSDPWLGIPVVWSHISGAGTIVEATIEGMSPELSQGSHFFHNIANHDIFYMSIECDSGSEKGFIDWNWIKKQPEIFSGRFFRHVRCREPFRILVDGQNNRGVVIQ